MATKTFQSVFTIAVEAHIFKARDVTPKRTGKKKATARVDVANKWKQGPKRREKKKKPRTTKHGRLNKGNKTNETIDNDKVAHYRELVGT